MMIAKKNLAQNLKRFRTQHHLSQFEFAESCGVSKDTIGFIEREQTNPTLDVLGDIAAFMGVPVDELLWDGEEVFVVKILKAFSIEHIKFFLRDIL